MRKQDVIDHFGSVLAVAKALGISKVAIYRWGEIIPKQRAFELVFITGGQLKVNRSLYG
jgi:hypothetical protein